MNTENTENEEKDTLTLEELVTVETLLTKEIKRLEKRRDKDRTDVRNILRLKHVNGIIEQIKKEIHKEFPF